MKTCKIYCLCYSNQWLPGNCSNK